MLKLKLSLIALVATGSLIAACDQHTVDPAPAVNSLPWQTIGNFGQDHSPTDVWGSGANDVFVSYANYGKDTALVHFDGNSWQDVALGPNDSYVNTVWGSGADDVYAASSDLWHYDGASWSSIHMHVNRVSGTARDNVIVTDDRYVIRFNGTVWDTLLDTADLYPSYPYAFWVGNGPNIILDLLPRVYGAEDSLVRFTNGSWSAPEPAPGIILAFAGDDPNDVIAVGASGNNGMAWHWDGMEWTPTMQPGEFAPLGDVQRLAPDDVYAASAGGVLHFDGNAWSSLDSMSTRGANRIWLSSATDVYSTSDQVSHFDGTGWQPVFPVEPVEPEALWASSRSHVVLGGQRGFYELKDGLWRKQKIDGYTGDVRAIAGPDTGNLYAATTLGVFHYDGASWTAMPNSPRYVTDLSLAPSGELFAAEPGDVYRYDAPGWTKIKHVSTFNGRNGIWAFARDNVLFGHAKGIERFNGATWTKLSDLACGDIWAAAPDNIYALGSRLILHSSGAEFTAVGPAAPNGLDRVVGTSADHVLGLGPSSYAELIRGSWTAAKSNQPSNTQGLSAGTDGSFIRLDEYSSRSYRLSYIQE